MILFWVIAPVAVFLLLCLLAWPKKKREVEWPSDSPKPDAYHPPPEAQPFMSYPHADPEAARLRVRDSMQANVGLGSYPGLGSAAPTSFHTDYPCGCSADGGAPLPEYCPDHPLGVKPEPKKHAHRETPSEKQEREHPHGPDGRFRDK